MLHLFQEEIISLLSLIIAGGLGVVAKYATSYFKKKGVISHIEAHKELAKIAVHAVEQTYKNLHGKEKLDVAKMEMVKLAKARGLKITEKDLDVLIESSVKQMNDAVKKELKN
jgi:LL-H family phage holin